MFYILMRAYEKNMADKEVMGIFDDIQKAHVAMVKVKKEAPDFLYWFVDVEELNKLYL